MDSVPVCAVVVLGCVSVLSKGSEGSYHVK